MNRGMVRMALAVGMLAAGAARTGGQESAAGRAMLAVTASCPARQAAGSPCVWRMTVSNAGTGEARNVTMVIVLPDGLECVSASEGAQTGKGDVRWALGVVPAGGTKQVTLTTTATRQGRYSAEVWVRADGGAAANVAATTVFDGVAKADVICTDRDDPVTVGQAAVYDMAVRNLGTAALKNVVLTCEIPANMRFTGAEGPGKFTVKGRTVRFEPVATLPPRDPKARRRTPPPQVAFRVTATAVKEGDVRFVATLTSDSLARAVREDESTHVEAGGL